MTNNETVVRNLRDAGCTPEAIERFLRLGEARRTDEQFRLLATCRAVLLAKVHEDQRQLDRLDYLIYQLKREVDQPAL